MVGQTNGFPGQSQCRTTQCLRGISIFCNCCGVGNRIATRTRGSRSLLLDFHCRQNALSIRLSDQSRHVQNALLACRLRQLHSDICAIADSLNIKFNYSLITLHGALMPLFSFICSQRSMALRSATADILT